MAAKKCQAVRRRVAWLCLAGSLGIGLVALASTGAGQEKPAGGGTKAAKAPAAKATPPANSTAKPAKQTATAPDATSSGDPVVARVNHQMLTYRALGEECVARKGREVLEELISKTLIMQACAQKGITVSPEEVEQETRLHAERLKLSREEYFKKVKDELGLSQREFTQHKVLPAVALKKLALPRVRVTEEDIQRGFEAEFGERVKCRMIMLDNLQNAMRIWNELRGAAKDGEVTVPLVEFERQVSRWSTDIATRTVGGKVPPISRQAQPAFPELQKAAFELQADGEISKVIQVGNSFVILYREERLAETGDKLEDKRDQIQAAVHESKLQEQIARVFQEIQQSATIENLLTGDVSKPQKKANAPSGEAVPPNTPPPAGGGARKSPAKKGPPAASK